MAGFVPTGPVVNPEVAARVAGASAGVGSPPATSGQAYFSHARRVGVPAIVPGTPYYDSLLKQQSRPDDDPEEIMTVMVAADGTVSPEGIIALGPAGEAAVAEIAANAQPAEEEDELAKKRVVINFGRTEEHYMLTVEIAPDWDSEGTPKKVEKAIVRKMVPILKDLGVKLKLNVDDLEDE